MRSRSFFKRKFKKRTPPPPPILKETGRPSQNNGVPAYYCGPYASWCKSPGGGGGGGACGRRSAHERVRVDWGVFWHAKDRMRWA